MTATAAAPEPVRLLAERLLSDYDAIPARERRLLQRVAHRVASNRPQSPPDEEHRTLGERLADQVAAAGGSWSFIISFGLVIFIWMLVNSGFAARLFPAFDPYPFIFLNLMLSLVAAVQAPVIMMSQNRQAAKDREQANHDYEVNLKAEIEIMALHEKLDELRQKDLAEMLARIEKILKG